MNKDEYQGFVDNNYAELVEEFVEIYQDEFHKFCSAAYDDSCADVGDALRDVEREKDGV